MRSDMGVYSMDAFRPKVAAKRRASISGPAAGDGSEEGSKPTFGARANTSASEHALRLGPEWKPTDSGGKVGHAAIPAYRADAYDLRRAEERRVQAAAAKKNIRSKPFQPTGVSCGSGPFGPVRNHISTTAVL
jgi:hypothetical protein